MNESTPPPTVMPGGNAIQPRFVLWCITIVAVGLSLFQLYSAGIQPLGLFYQRSIHLALIMMLAFLSFLASSGMPWHTTWLMEVQVALGKPW